MSYGDDALPDGKADPARAKCRRVRVKKSIAGLAGLIGALMIATSAHAMIIPAAVNAASVQVGTPDVTVVQYRDTNHRRHYVRRHYQRHRMHGSAL